jgi:sugar phosphate isomerase/epimerase
MFKALNCNAIGIKGYSLPDTVALAKATGFAAVDFDIRGALALPDAKALFTGSGIRPATWGLPVNGPQSEWSVDPAELATCARFAADLGCHRCVTWVPSWSDSRDIVSNTAFHVEKLAPVARVLADHGIALGLEFLGPVTLFQDHKHPFIHTMAPMVAMARQIGPNVGLLLDAWHLFTSGGTLADLSNLTARDIVHVHINDAPIGVPFDKVHDQTRHLPLETGVLNLTGFMQTLAALGYDGPVVTEPFNARLNALAATDPTAAASEVSAAMDRLWQISGL